MAQVEKTCAIRGGELRREIIGEKRGIQQGMPTKSLEIARNMLQKREPGEKVVE